ncbi:MAG: ATP-dependent 6-phosphofructokinase [Chloroflexota bacterium]|nr:ATP-dependent 6-phosphofructokinase [Dehalococcoidia bacterium]MDW8253085.1 ATP-dependent 6-phosphofructokinase [Chloroflexota bacterium]
MAVRRIGVLTGGGDAPGLNAVIRAVVKTAIHEYGWEVIGIRNGFEGLIPPSSAGPLTLDGVRGILPRGGTILGTANRGSPFVRRVTAEGRVELVDQTPEAIATLDELGIDALVVIGGDGTLNIAHELAKRGVPVVGVPKTIDNDLPETDQTFGFDTAVLTATEAIDKLHTTAESHHRVMVLEVMGRDAGWIAIHAGIAGGADVILIPEIPFHVRKVVEKIAERDRAGRHFSIVVVAEGAKAAGSGQFYVKPKDELSLGRLGGIGEWLSDTLAMSSGHESRCTVLGHLQRGGTPTAFDRVLATRYGAAAARAIAKGRVNHMVALKGNVICEVPLEQCVGRIRTVPPDGELVQTARGLGISLGV